MQIVTEWTAGAATDPREITLLRRAKTGDSAAMEDLLGTRERQLFSLCFGVLGSPADAEDAVQETFLRALRSLAKFRGDSGFHSWIYRIALNVCLEWKRSRKSLTEYPQEDSSRPTYSPESHAIQSLLIQEALRTLPPRIRAVWLLKELEGWSVSEIAETMACREKRIHNELYRARRMLAEWRERESEGDTK